MIFNYTNVKIKAYDDFVSIVENLGFMPLTKNCIGFPSLDSETGLTDSDQWHTGLPSDPWPWRVKIESDHKAAYAKLFDNKPGFISLEWYPIFLSARRKGRSFNEVNSEGVISNYAKKIYSLFDSYDVLATHEIKALCGFTKETISKYEAAMNELQMRMFITTNGMKYKTAKNGEPYGWPATAYSTVETWAGKEIIEAASAMDPLDAMDEILLRINNVTPDAGPKLIKRFIGF